MVGNGAFLAHFSFIRYISRVRVGYVKGLVNGIMKR